jgi:hypothetical protein
MSPFWVNASSIAAVPAVDTGGVSPLSQVMSDTDPTSRRTQLTWPHPRLSVVASINNSPLVHVSLAWPDADPASTHILTYRGSPISLSPADDVIFLLGPADVQPLQVPFAPIPTDIPCPSLLVPDTLSLLLKGVDTLFARQDQDRVEDREDHRCYEKNIQDMLGEHSLRSSVVSTSVVAPMDTHVGQYYTPPNTRELYSLSPRHRRYLLCHLRHSTNHHRMPLPCHMLHSR